MLRLYPDKRAKASELVHHSWMDGIVVQGELEVIRRAEEDELLRREAERSRNMVRGGASGVGLGALGALGTVGVGLGALVGGAVGAMGVGPSPGVLADAQKRKKEESARDEDAMKPVGEVGDGVEEEYEDEGEGGEDEGGQVIVPASLAPGRVSEEIITSSKGGKENIRQGPPPQHQQQQQNVNQRGHKHVGSKGQGVRIDTGKR